MVAMYVMCGVPGSGKTTRSKQMAEEMGLVRFSYDEMRCYRQESFLRHAAEAMREGKNVILDTVNLTANVRKKLLRYVEDIPCQKIVVFMDVPLEECQRRNANREMKLPDRVIKNLHQGLQPPTDDEGWDEIHVYKD